MSSMTNTFYIEIPTSYGSKECALSLIQSGFVAKTATISYNPEKGLPSPESGDYPLTLHGTFCNAPAIMKVYSMTAGYPGTGPNDLCDVLRAAGFLFDEEDILTKRKADHNGLIHLIYTR